MSMSPLLFRRSLHSRAGPGSFFDLSHLVVARSDRATFSTLTQCLRAADRAVVFTGRACAARLAAIPAGESPANRGVQSLL